MSETSDDRPPGKLLGSLRDALNATASEGGAHVEPESTTRLESFHHGAMPAEQPSDRTRVLRHSAPLPSAKEAARAARGGSPNVPPLDRHIEFESSPAEAHSAAEQDAPVRTQLVRGRQPIKRGKFYQDPVVGWLVVVGGPGLGAYRPIFEGNNTIGRSPNQRIPIDFGDDAISSEEQAYIRYDSAERSFLFVPNLAKTNIVSVNDKRPTAAIPLQAMDVITMGRTQLVFVPFCGPEFDWSELPDIKD